MVEKLAYTVEEAAKALGVSERTFRAMVARSEVRVCHIGRRVVVPIEALRDLLADPAAAAAEPAAVAR